MEALKQRLYQPFARPDSVFLTDWQVKNGLEGTLGQLMTNYSGIFKDEYSIYIYIIFVIRKLECVLLLTDRRLKCRHDNYNNTNLIKNSKNRKLVRGYFRYLKQIRENFGIERISPLENYRKNDLLYYH